MAAVVEFLLETICRPVWMWLKSVATINTRFSAIDDRLASLEEVVQSGALTHLVPYKGVMVGRRANPRADDPPNEIFCEWCFQRGKQSRCSVDVNVEEDSVVTTCDNPAHSGSVMVHYLTIREHHHAEHVVDPEST